MTNWLSLDLEKADRVIKPSARQACVLDNTYIYLNTHVFCHVGHSNKLYNKILLITM